MGKMKNKTTGKIYTLQTLPEDVIQKMNEKLQEKKISRRSVVNRFYSAAIQACSYRVLDKDDETTMKKIHDFCFTKLVKKEIKDMLKMPFGRLEIIDNPEIYVYGYVGYNEKFEAVDYMVINAAGKCHHL